VKTKGESANFIIIAGKPMNEEIVSYGPFVLSSEEQLDQTFEDFQDGKNGFENAPGWKSEIRKLAQKNPL